MKQSNFYFKKGLWVVVSLIFITLFAQLTIEVPIKNQQIPISGQTFAVLLVGFVLRRKWGTLTLLLYLFLGALGLPIFADGESGIAVIQGGSGGFLIGFVVGAYVVGWLTEQGWGVSFWKCLLAMFLGTVVIMSFGVARLSYLYDFGKAMEWGFYPFVPGAIVKIILGAIAAFLIEKR